MINEELRKELRKITYYTKGYVPIYDFMSLNFILIPYEAIVEEILSNPRWKGTFIPCNRAITKEDSTKLEKIVKK